MTNGIDPRAGGVSAAVVGLAQAQATAGLTVSVAVAYGAGEDTSPAETLRGADVNVHLIGPTRPPLRWHPAMRTVLTQAITNADIVHVHALWEQVQHLAIRLASAHDKPIVLTPHGMLDPWSLKQSRWKKRLYRLWRLNGNLRRVSRVHFTAAQERDQSQSATRGRPSIVEPNGLHYADYEKLPPPGTFARYCPEVRDQRYVVFLGRVHPKKGLDLLLPAFARVSSDAVLVIAGPGDPEYKNSLMDAAKRLSIAERTVFLDMLTGDSKLAALHEADLFALPSYHENFGIAVAEALATGTPVVISDRVNIHDEIAAARAGAVVPPTVDALSDALQNWLNDDAGRRDAGEAGRRLVRQRYDWPRIADRWAGHYSQMTHLVAPAQTSASQD